MSIPTYRETARPAAEEPPPRRRYDNARRRQRAAETRARIVAEGAALARSLRTWDWEQLTIRAVAVRAGVSESTAYRHFTNERELHDAVMRHLEDEAGVTYQGVSLDEVAGVASRVFASLSAFAASQEPGADASVVAADRERGQALRDAVAAAAPHWSPDQRDAAASILDVLWSPLAFQRLSKQWGMTPQRATDAIAWGIGIVVASVRDGTAPEAASSDTASSDNTAGPTKGQRS
jgi:AcrR family transcriptional regulator